MEKRRLYLSDTLSTDNTLRLIDTCRIARYYGFDSSEVYFLITKGMTRQEFETAVRAYKEEKENTP